MGKFVVVVHSDSQWKIHQGVRYPVVERECGHRHRTLLGAVKCQKKLYRHGGWDYSHISGATIEQVMDAKASLAGF
jgi:hypothetical protein